MNITLNRFSHKVGANFWHMEWCPKYRYKMMQKYENKNLVAAAIRKAAYEHGVKIHYLKVLPITSFPSGWHNNGSTTI